MIKKNNNFVIPQSAIRKHTPYFPTVIDIIVLCYLGHAPFGVRPRSNKFRFESKFIC